jgi:hypothetical protein
MAIRFVDKGPEDRTGEPAKQPRAEPAGAPVQPAGAPVQPAGPAPAEASLPHAKPEPKPRGRHKPPSSSVANPDAESQPAQASLDGLLPALPHAKPEPKPRGRKKAFG